MTDARPAPGRVRRDGLPALLLTFVAPFAALFLGLFSHPLDLAVSEGAIHSRVEQWRPLAERAAAAEGLPVELLLGLVATESAGRRGALSSAGAVGLTQVLPATARGEAVRMGLLAPESLDLYEPSLNLRLGASYLADQLRTFSGDIHLALAAYHSGPGKPMAWRRREPGASGLQLVEKYGTPATRAYVARVQQRRLWFLSDGPRDPAR